MSDPTVPPTLPPEFGVYFALLEVSALVQRGVEGQLRRDGGLSFVQFQILAILGEDPSPRSMTDLANRLVHSKSGLTYQVDRLEQAGLVARVPSEEDERGVNVTPPVLGGFDLLDLLDGAVRNTVAPVAVRTPPAIKNTVESVANVNALLSVESMPARAALSHVPFG